MIMISACDLHGIEPWAYVRDVLTLVPGWPNRDVLQPMATQAGRHVEA
jgi:transposase